MMWLCSPALCGVTAAVIPALHLWRANLVRETLFSFSVYSVSEGFPAEVQVLRFNCGKAENVKYGN